MAVRPITIIGHKALHQPTRRVREVTGEVRDLVRDMFDTLDAANGAGPVSYTHLTLPTT